MRPNWELPAGKDRRIGIFILFLWAHFWRFAPKTGLSAPIPQNCSAIPPGFPLQSLAHSVEKAFFPYDSGRLSVF
jgi:hypothetical protein